MRLSTFIASKEDIFEDRIILREDINHLKNVLRLKIGDDLRIVDGYKEYFCKIKVLEKGQAVLDISEIKEAEKEKIFVTAAIALIKSQNFSTIVKELTEIGISNLIPLYTKRTVIQDFNLEKWNKISKEALKQCGGIKFMNIFSPIKLKDLKFDSYDLKILAYEKENNYTLWNVLKESKASKPIFIIGPEGGFEEEEVQFLKEQSFKSISLGKRILRAETASILLGGSLINGL